VALASSRIFRFMGTMSSAHSAPASTVKASRWKFWLAAVLLLFAAFVAWNFSSWKRQAEVGSAYAARVACSCRFVQGRELASCLTDFDPGTEMVSVEEIPDERRIRASVPLLASRTARFAGATGCVLERD
jgi:hypothetical protein